MVALLRSNGDIGCGLWRLPDLSHGRKRRQGDAGKESRRTPGREGIQEVRGARIRHRLHWVNTASAISHGPCADDRRGVAISSEKVPVCTRRRPRLALLCSGFSGPQLWRSDYRLSFAVLHAFVVYAAGAGGDQWNRRAALLQVVSPEVSRAEPGRRSPAAPRNQTHGMSSSWAANGRHDTITGYVADQRTGHRAVPFR